MTIKPVQSAPNFNTGAVNPMLAQLYYVQAKQAYATQQWQQVCVHAQACVVAARQDVKLRFLAKELLAVGLTNLKQFESALVVFLELHQLKLTNASILNNIGLVLTQLKRDDEAIKYFQKAVELEPNHVEFGMNLGFASYRLQDYKQAIEDFRKIENIAPLYTESKFGKALSFQAEGRIYDALETYEQILKIAPNYLMAQNNIIFIQHYLYPIDMHRQMLLLQRFRASANEALAKASHTKASHTPLKVGFISADFREHPVSYFLESTIKQLKLNPQLNNQLMLIAYSNHSKLDKYAEHLRSRFDQWHVVDTWSDDVLLEQIKQDQIDILIDLSGHTQGGRLSIFAKKAAPLQVSWLGYFGSTGLSNMDYVLADPVSVPEDEEKWFSEKIWRLPNLRYCFSTPHDVPDVSPPPCIDSPTIVAGCYQAANKINDGVLRCWVNILDACPNIHLRIQSIDFVNSELKDQFVERMRKVGINIHRVDLVDKMTRNEYLESYAKVDILLDTFPYPGGTTTAEALWMGVPTLTLALPNMLGRQGEALMVNAGLSGWVAYSEDEYVQKAIAWGNADAQKRQELANLRTTLREQVRVSPVFDAKQFSNDFVDALYGMWNEKYGS